MRIFRACICIVSAHSLCHMSILHRIHNICNFLISSHATLTISFYKTLTNPEANMQRKSGIPLEKIVQRIFHREYNTKYETLSIQHIDKITTDFRKIFIDG